MDSKRDQPRKESHILNPYKFLDLSEITILLNQCVTSKTAIVLGQTYEDLM